MKKVSEKTVGKIQTEENKMKTKRMYGFISSLLAAMMLFSTFSCGKSEGAGESASSDQSSTSTSSDSSSSGPSEAPEDEYFLTRGEKE